MARGEPDPGPVGAEHTARQPSDGEPDHRVHTALPCDDRAPRVARGLVARALAGSDVASLTDAALLVVSELVTNAAQHSSRRLDFDLWVGAASLQIAVSDDCSEQPVPREPGPLEQGGRGLPLVDALVSARRVVPDRGGKSVWCRLDADRRPQSG